MLLCGGNRNTQVFCRNVAEVYFNACAFSPVIVGSYYSFPTIGVFVRGFNIISGSENITRTEEAILARHTHLTRRLVHLTQFLGHVVLTRGCAPC